MSVLDILVAYMADRNSMIICACFTNICRHHERCSNYRSSLFKVSFVAEMVAVPTSVQDQKPQEYHVSVLWRYGTGLFAHHNLLVDLAFFSLN